MNEHRKIARRIQLHIKPDGSLGRTKLRPVEKSQAEINDCRIQAVKGILNPEFMLRCQRQTFGQHAPGVFFTAHGSDAHLHRPASNALRV